MYHGLETINCPHCDEALRVSSGDNKGFALQLKLVCNRCHFKFGSTHSSPVLDNVETPQPFVISDIMVLLFNHLGLGHTAMREFYGVLGIPAMHLKTFQKKEKRIIDCGDKQRCAAAKCRRYACDAQRYQPWRRVHHCQL